MLLQIATGAQEPQAEQGDHHHLSDRGDAFLVPAPAALAMAECREGSWFIYLSQSLPAKVRLAGHVKAAPFCAVPKVNLFCTVQKQVRVE